MPPWEKYQKLKEANKSEEQGPWLKYQTGGSVIETPVIESVPQPPPTLERRLIEGNRPVAAGLLRTAKDVVTPSYHFANQALFNLPRAVATKAGMVYPETQNPVANVLAKGAGVAGGVVSPIGAALSKIGLSGAKLGTKIAKGALAGGLGGAAYTPTDDIVALKKRGMNAVGGAILGGMVPAVIGKIQGSKRAFKFIPATDEKKIGLAETVRANVLKTKQSAVNEFGEQVEKLAQSNPNKTISLRETVDAINLDPNLPAEIRGVFNKTPILRDLLAKPELADNVSLKDTQEIINYINTKVPKTIKATHIDLLDHLDDIKAAQLDAFPEMEGIRAGYRAMKQNYNLIKSGLKEASLLENLGKNWQNAEIRAAFKKMVNPQTLELVKNYQDSLELLRLAGLVTKWGTQAIVAGGAAGAVLKVASHK